MDFAGKKSSILRIVAKYRFFVASLLYYGEIHRKLDEIETDLSDATAIRTFLTFNFGRDTKYNLLLPLVQQTIDRLDRILVAVNERREQLEQLKNALVDGCDIDEFLRSVVF